MTEATEFWYIKCKTDTLRSVNDSTPIVNSTVGDNVYPTTLTQRQTIEAIGTLVGNKTVALCRSADLAEAYSSALPPPKSTVLKVSAALKNALLPYLDDAEEATASATNIISGTGNGTPNQQHMHPSLFNVYIAGDSIDYGVGIKTPTSTEIYTLNFDGMEEFHYSRLAIEAVDTNVRSESYFNSKEPVSPEGDRLFLGDKIAVHKIAVGGASYANTVGTEDQVDFIHVFNLKYNQIYKTMNLNTNSAILIGFGTNDTAYDTSLTAQELFDIEKDAILKFKEDHPNTKIIAVTDIRRTDDTTLNQRIHDFNQKRRDPATGCLSYGVDYLCDFADPSKTHANFHPLTGTITTGANGLFADGDVVHPSKLGHYYLSKPLIPILSDLLGVQSVTLKRVHITNNIVREHSSIGTVVGTLFNFQDGSIVSLVNGAGGRFSLSGNNILVNADIDFSEGYKHNITIRETLASVSNSPKDTVINILIGNLAPVYPIARFPLDPALSATAAGRPQITGSPFTGSVLTADNGTWFHTVDSYVVQWKRDGVNFTGTTTYTYLLTPTDVGCEFTFEVVAINSNGSTTNVSLGLMIGPVLDVPTVSDENVSLLWALYNDTGVTNYIIEYKLAAADDWIVFNDGVSTVKSTTVTGLTTGTYNFRVKAVKGNKTSTASNIQNAIVN
jgi:hypothetical protein